MSGGKRIVTSDIERRSTEQEAWSKNFAVPFPTPCSTLLANSAMPQFLITALGSYGDVHPMVGVGAALAARGHRVKIVTNPYFEEVVASAGLELLPLGTRDDYVRLSQHPHLWHPVRGPKLVLGHATARMLRPLYDLLVANYEPGDTVFCAHCLDMASRVAGEKLDAPVASLVFAPALLWTLHDSPRLKGALLGPWVPRWMKRIQFWFSDALFVQPLLGPELNARAPRARFATRAKNLFAVAFVERPRARDVSRLVRPATTRLASDDENSRFPTVGHAGVSPQSAGLCPHFRL